MLFDYLSGSRFVAELYFVVYPDSCYCLILLKKLNLDQEFFEYPHLSLTFLHCQIAGCEVFGHHVASILTLAGYQFPVWLLLFGVIVLSGILN